MNPMTLTKDLGQCNIGAIYDSNGVFFRVWANGHKQVELFFTETRETIALQAEEGGYFSTFVPHLPAGTLYKFRIDGKNAYPDPSSRFQPHGPHGPSMVINSQSYVWKDAAWKGPSRKGQIHYELHVGAFSPEGTFTGVTKKLAYLKDLGVTVIELMPVCEFPGRWNWGYDGVSLFAPCHIYGHPDDLKELIDASHALGIAVILDVVYNHLGPDGNYLKEYSEDYFAPGHTTDWGEAINYYGKNAAFVRDFFIQNACYWVKDFHFDGLRLDATQNIYDLSAYHIIAEISDKTRKAAGGRQILMIGENESQDTHYLHSQREGGYGLDGLWNDDFHHCCHVALTGRREAYYSDYLGSPQEFISLAKHGYLYQGQYYKWQHKKRGSQVDADIEAAQFIVYIQNHDQIANSLNSERIHRISDPGLLRTLTAYWLLSPHTPMLFMGQEFGSSAHFFFFADHNPELAPLVHKGRQDFLAQFPSYSMALDEVAAPHKESVFKSSKLDFREVETNRHIFNLHKDLIALRKSDEVIGRQDRHLIDGAVLPGQAFALRYFGEGSDRLLIINLGVDLEFLPCPEPLLVPIEGRNWELLWSSEEPDYGGNGVANPYTGRGWIIPARSAHLFSSLSQSGGPHGRTDFKN